MMIVMRSWALRASAGLVATIAIADASPAGALSLGPAASLCAHVQNLVNGARLTREDGYALAALLLVLARGLAGRRRLAHHLLVGLIVAGALAPPHRPDRLAFFAAAGAALLGLRGTCAVRPDPRRLRGAAQAGLAALAVVLLHGAWLVTVDGAPAGASARGALPLGAAPVGWPATAFVVAFVGAGAFALSRALAPALGTPGTDGERARVRALAGHPDSDSLAPFAVRADKSYVFSPDGTAAIGYRVLFGVALAGGDPVGASRSTAAAVSAFAELCVERGWRPAVLGASTSTLPHWRRAGLRRGLVIGDEAILDATTFSLSSRRMRNVRQAVRRSLNAGVRVQVRTLDERLAGELAPVLADWLGGRVERGFAMNLDRILQPVPDALVAVAYDRDWRPQSFARFLQCGGGRVLTLDVAPRRHDAPNGTVERLIVEVVRHARTHGVREVSLNFAGMRRVYTTAGGPARAAAALLRVFDRWIELRPLFRFSAKFHPHWRPRSLLMRSWWEVAAVGAAALVAELGRTRGGVEDVGGLAEQPAPA
jgi:lysylphosphatidylglycerol synthetase-like protein (DUF2156 family)